mmetsp:Transcript_17298/g.37202  ORF Transcript_17298/g.37202 Transcript_17298/m.37202 type:complete len:458 (-) Transcript_17298:101-1474(-)|eukprot:CAMPEP_0206468816 /NCGR_PEP_ID=MMETSP0324_2-20121206/29874_1 /ASSEMBLY_ACC=CAM_ASM_000836 /TAXON_ID=2866 /ORGANISM="Crypthecodinium cohnii, Strain Seligo" /LENGTH=457 /DNA_ID=CAMNT_0053942385 /DNA_START=62 /DNA_END=1435 /DNA_ORIENTATION=+
MAVAATSSNPDSTVCSDFDFDCDTELGSELHPEFEGAQEGAPGGHSGASPGLAESARVAREVTVASLFPACPGRESRAATTLPIPSAAQRTTTVPLRTAEDDSHGEVRATRTLSWEAREASVVRGSFQRPQTWVLIFGWSLAVCAGIVNVVAFRSWGAFVSHMTGDTTTIGTRIEGVTDNHVAAYQLQKSVSILLSFLFGAFLCGILIDKNQVHFGGKSCYGFALVGNSILLFSSMLISSHSVAASLAAIACGLQNAMCTSHFGAIVRTTHVTGTVTDIGSTTGRIAMLFLRKRCRGSQLSVLDRAEVEVDARKLVVLLPMLLSYFSGTVAGAYLHNSFGVFALGLPAILTGVVGLIYTLLGRFLSGFLKHLEADQFAKEFQDVKGTLDRTQQVLSSFKKSRHFSEDRLGHATRSTDSLIDLEQGFEDLMERMRELSEEMDNISESPARSLTLAASR